MFKEVSPVIEPFILTPAVEPVNWIPTFESPNLALVLFPNPFISTVVSSSAVFILNTEVAEFWFILISLPLEKSIPPWACITFVVLLPAVVTCCNVGVEPIAPEPVK